MGRTEKSDLFGTVQVNEHRRAKRWTALLCSPASHLPAKSQGAPAPAPALVGSESPVDFEESGGLVQVRVAPPGPFEKRRRTSLSFSWLSRSRMILPDLPFLPVLPARFPQTTMRRRGDMFEPSVSGAIHHRNVRVVTRWVAWPQAKLRTLATWIPPTHPSR